MATTIVTKNGSGAPTASDLVAGELAVDLTNGRLYTENSSAAVVELGSNPSGNITFGDNGKAIFGAGSDLQIYHDASDSVILDNGTGNLKIQANDLVLKNADGSKEYLKGTDGGSVRVRYNNTTVLETTATGVDITGTATIKAAGADASRTLSIQGTNGSSQIYQFNIVADGENSAAKFMIGSGGGAATERMRIDSSGSVGIATTSPDSGYKLDVAGNVAFGDGGGFDMNVDGTRWQFSLGGSEKMRIDGASGNLLVGKTSTTFSVAGVENRADGRITSTRSGNTNLLLNRLSSDGDIVQLYKDGTAVGSISNQNAYFFISGGSVGGTHSGFRFIDQQSFRPCTSAGANLDDTVDLGNSAARFDDIYATNGTIQTSDRNEKQDIEALSDAEQRVAVACKGLLRKFRWKSSVAENGDEARIHFGIIAQDLQAAFAAEGLDAGDYAMFINSTWTDEETGEERSRMGVRYSELLAFIIAAI